MIAELYSERRLVHREGCPRPGVFAVWPTNAAGGVWHFPAIVASPSRLDLASPGGGTERSSVGRLLP